MMLLHDRQFQILLALLLGVLSSGSLVGIILARSVRTEKGKETVANLNARVKAWWAMRPSSCCPSSSAPSGPSSFLR